MKRVLLLLALPLMLMLVFLTGCDNNQDNKHTNENPDATVVSVNDSEAPVIVIEDGKKNISIKYGESIDLLDGVSVSDNIDTDIQIKTDGQFDNKCIGTYTIKYNAEDSSKNKAVEVTKTVTVLWNSPLTFIGHAGCYYGIMNTEEAFLNAVKLGYQAIECDIKQTSDGVFVVCHDNDFGGAKIASTTYENLKNVENTVSRGGVNYTSKICTLKRYLEICKDNNVKAVVELKSSNGITNTDQSRMAALMAEITACGMLDRVIFLGSQYNCLIWVKQNGYEKIPCQYLVNSIESDEIFNRCKQYGLDVSFNISNTNSKEWIVRYQDEGIKVACYTFNQYQNASTLQNWIDLGVDFVTCDKLVPSDVVIPLYEGDAQQNVYTVRFVDSDGSLLKEVSVNEGDIAAPPLEPSKAGYTFEGWDKATTRVNSNMTVTARYLKTEYKITYYGNCVKRNAVQWTGKTEFVTEFFNDFFEWFCSHAGGIVGLSKSGDTYTLVLNGQTVTFKNAADILATDIYVFEKTFANYIYAPVTRTAESTAVIPTENTEYFLNTSLYRVKYTALDAYFLKACKDAYPAYNMNYEATSAGKVQIFFRFMQWATNKANIAAFDTLPQKTVESAIPDVTVTVPTTPVTFTVEDELILPDATVQGARFMGWFASPGCDGAKIEKIEKGTVNDVVLYAKIVK